MAIDRVAKAWGKIAEETGCAIELVHHVRKNGGHEVSVENSRGAVALLAAARSARVLNPMSEIEAGKAAVDNRRQYFRADSGKANLAPLAKAQWYHIVPVPLGNGSHGRGGDVVGVVTSWRFPDPLENLSSDALEKVQQAVASGRWRRDIQAKDWVGHAIAEALSLGIDNKVDKARVSELLKAWIGSGALVVVDEKDANHETRKFVKVGKLADDLFGD